MADLRIERPTTDAMLEDWRHVHNVIVPPAALSLEEVRDRARRNVLEVAYLDDVLVGCTTVRAPDEDGAVTVIARVLPEHRRQGIGGQLYARAMEHASGARVVETVVLESNADGLAFALARGFVEVERYVLPGEEARWVTLRARSCLANSAGFRRKGRAAHPRPAGRGPGGTHSSSYG